MRIQEQIEIKCEEQETDICSDERCLIPIVWFPWCIKKSCCCLVGDMLLPWALQRQGLRDIICRNNWYSPKLYCLLVRMARFVVLQWIHVWAHTSPHWYRRYCCVVNNATERQNSRKGLRKLQYAKWHNTCVTQSSESSTSCTSCIHTLVALVWKLQSWCMDHIDNDDDDDVDESDDRIKCRETTSEGRSHIYQRPQSHTHQEDK